MDSLQQPKTEMKACFHLVTFINQSAKHSHSMGATVATRVVRMCWMKIPHWCLHCCIQNAMQSQSSRTKSASSVPVSVHQCRTQCATRDRSLHNETYRCVSHIGAHQHTRAHDGSARGEFPSARVVNLGPSAALSLWLVLSRSFVALELRLVGDRVGESGTPSSNAFGSLSQPSRFPVSLPAQQPSGREGMV
ncbi:hypothetical protein RP20_CCG021892 [Aedes albopictus]|nr:hypothetical protein RP20_CCG021892 [Aedes albopictus]